MSCTSTIFLAFHNHFMILVHMEVHSKYHLLMVHSIQIRSGVLNYHITIQKIVTISKYIPVLKISYHHLHLLQQAIATPSGGRLMQSQTQSITNFVWPITFNDDDNSLYYYQQGLEATIHRCNSNSFLTWPSLQSRFVAMKYLGGRSHFFKALSHHFRRETVFLATLRGS